MTDDLSRDVVDGPSAEASDADGAREQAKTAVISGGGGQNLVGQAGITNVQVDRPAAGQTATYDAQPGETFVINFDPAAAQVEVDGDNLILRFADGGRIVFTGGADPDLAQDGSPLFNIDGTLVPMTIIASAARGDEGQGGPIDLPDTYADPLDGSGGPGIYAPRRL